jgi:membrane dipeptidase
MIDRRDFLISGGLAAAALATRVASGAQGDIHALYAHATVIDALGGPGEPDQKPGSLLSAKALEDVRASGLTAVNVTVSGVGSYAKDYDTTIRNIANAIGFERSNLAGRCRQLLNAAFRKRYLRRRRAK